MATLLPTQELIKERLNKQAIPTILFVDFDGTVFSPNYHILSAPFTNRKTASFLSSRNIPFVIVTGRSDWGEIDKRQLALLGLPQPEVVITANGTIIYTLLSNKIYTRDMEWESLMQYSKITQTDGTLVSWNKSAITQVLKDYLLTQGHPFTFGTGNTFLIRITLLSIPFLHLQQIKQDILNLFPSGLRIIYTEKLLRKNTLSTFSGQMLITPKLGGKDNAVKYLLGKYSKEAKKIIHATIFGDATVDIPMLTMKDNPKYYTLSQYLVHPTPLARKDAEIAQKTNTHLYILPGDGPKEILKVITKGVTTPPTPVASFSPAQNNPTRQIVKKFEPFLDRLVDKKLSPNEISFLGLNKVAEGLKKLYKPNNSPLEKFYGFYTYGFGNLTDILDGIRARQRPESFNRQEGIPGQLVDGFSDRAKEFMQLFIRAKQRASLQTFLTAVSCVLPSIARAQVEILGKVVPERDEKGGSMIDRTKKLFYSLFLDTLGAHKKSEAIDQQIYSANIATFKNRLGIIANESEKLLPRHPELISKSHLSDFQKKALERWLLYIDVLQQEDAIIKKYVSKQPLLLKEYEKESQKLAKDYLVLPVNKLRKKWSIQNYTLAIKQYL